MKAGIESGLISEERLSDALHRILGLKAMLGLHHLTFPEKEGLASVGSAEHHEAAARAADESITLVKDTQHILPVDPSDKKRILLYYVQSAPESLTNGSDKGKQMLIDELISAGHARALLSINDLSLQVQTAMKVFDEKLCHKFCNREHIDF